MKVVKPGRNQVGWAKEFECTGSCNGDGGCGAILLVEQGDLYLTQSHCLDNTESFITFKCSQCGVETDIDNLSVPQHIRSKLLVKNHDTYDY